MATVRLFNLGEIPILPADMWHVGRVAKSKDRLGLPSWYLQTWKQASLKSQLDLSDLLAAANWKTASHKLSVPKMAWLPPSPLEYWCLKFYSCHFTLTDLLDIFLPNLLFISKITSQWFSKCGPQSQEHQDHMKTCMGHCNTSRLIEKYHVPVSY